MGALPEYLQAAAAANSSAAAATAPRAPGSAPGLGLASKKDAPFSGMSMPVSVETHAHTYRGLVATFLHMPVVSYH